MIKSGEYLTSAGHLIKSPMPNLKNCDQQSGQSGDVSFYRPYSPWLHGHRFNAALFSLESHSKSNLAIQAPYLAHQYVDSTP